MLQLRCLQNSSGCKRHLWQAAYIKQATLLLLISHSTLSLFLHVYSFPGALGLMNINAAQMKAIHRLFCIHEFLSVAPSLSHNPNPRVLLCR